jgi:hypothetical protein
MGTQSADEAKAQRDLLWGMYTDFRIHGRHAETLRATVVNVMLVVASVLFAVVGNDRRIRFDDLPFCVGVVLIGLFGLAFSASYTELHDRNRLRAMRIRKELDRRVFAQTPRNIATLVDEADMPHRKSAIYRRSRVLTGSTKRFWLLLPLFVLMVGLVLTGMSASR